MSLADALSTFEQAVNDFDLALSDYSVSDEAEAEEAAKLLARFEKFRLEQFRTVQANFFNIVRELMTEGQEFTFGDKVVKRGWTTAKKNWQHKALTEHLFARLKDMSMNEDGEITLTPRQAIDGILGCAHIDNWRKRDLAKFDINPDSFVDLDEPQEIVTVGKAI